MCLGLQSLAGLEMLGILMDMDTQVHILDFRI